MTGRFVEVWEGIVVFCFFKLWLEVSWQEPKSQGVLNSYVMLLLFAASKNAAFSCCAAGW